MKIFIIVKNNLDLHFIIIINIIVINSLYVKVNLRNLQQSYPVFAKSVSKKNCLWH
jgi:hypothetical protein